MEFIIENISLKTLVQDTASIIISILIGFIIWMVKKSYDEYCGELASLKRLEISLSTDLARCTSNKEYFENWLGSLNNNRLYTCAFMNYYLDNSELVHIKNLSLVNKINTLSFCLNTLHGDLKNTFDLYSSNSIKFLDGNHVQEWMEMNRNIVEQLKVFETNFSEAEKSIKDAVAYLRAYYNQKKISPYKVFGYLSVNIYPSITEKSIQRELELLNKNLDDKARKH